MPHAESGTKRVYFLYPGHGLSPEEERGLDLTSAALREAYTLAARGGARLIVAFAPTTYRAYAPTVKFEAGAEGRSWIVNDLPQRLRGIVRGISDTLTYVDLTPALSTAAQSGELPYFWDDSHWSPAGHALVARVLSDTILAHDRRTDKPENRNTREEQRPPTNARGVRASATPSGR
jgi:hypothetical protein